MIDIWIQKRHRQAYLDLAESEKSIESHTQKQLHMELPRSTQAAQQVSHESNTL